MLSTRNPPQKKNFALFEGKGMDKKYSMQMETNKIDWIAIYLYLQNRCQNKGHNKRQRRLQYITNGINQTNVYNTYKHICIQYRNTLIYK